MITKPISSKSIGTQDNGELSIPSNIMVLKTLFKVQISGSAIRLSNSEKEVNVMDLEKLKLYVFCIRKEKKKIPWSLQCFHLHDIEISFRLPIPRIKDKGDYVQVIHLIRYQSKSLDIKVSFPSYVCIQFEGTFTNQPHPNDPSKLMI